MHTDPNISAVIMKRAGKVCKDELDQNQIE